MKAKFIRFSAMLLVIWYCFSVIGFSVHTCNASGRSFIATFISGLSCSDIHPEHKCDKNHCGAEPQNHCCAEHAQQCLSSMDCCSSDNVALDLTGYSLKEGPRFHDMLIVASLPVYSSFCQPQHSVSDLVFEHAPPGGLFLNGKVRAFLNVWRI